MPAIATGDGSCSVFSPDGREKDCKFPMITSTDICSTKVFVGNYGVVRKGDRIAPHSKSGCVPDTSVLSSFSSKVFVEGEPVGRIGDNYGDNKIISGSSKVFVGG